MKNIKVDKMYYVQEWTNAVIEGEGFFITYHDHYQKEAGFFRLNEKDEWKLVSKKELYIDKESAMVGAMAENKKRINWYNSQIKEYQEKLKNIENGNT